MKPSRIRELARRYAAGELSLDEYRAQRRKLINGISSGIQKLEYGEPSPAHWRQLHLRRLAGIALLVMAAGIGIFTWTQHVHQLKQDNSQTRGAPESGSALVRTFIETNDWTDASLVQFLQRWKSLSAHEQKAAYSSYLYPRLQAQLREQIASQKAVVDLAAGENSEAHPASIHLAHLQQLAKTLKSNP